MMNSYGKLGGSGSYDTLWPSMVGAVMFCGMAKKDGIEAPLAGRNDDNREIASNVCPVVLS
jgi:hypothetical protein